MQRVLAAAVHLNVSQEQLHASLHALSSCRQVLGILPTAAYADRRIAPRLSLLGSVLSLLTPPPFPLPPSTISGVAPTYARASLALLRSLGPYWRVNGDLQLELISLTLRGLLPPAEPPESARAPLYLTLLALLAPLEAANGVPSLSHAYGELRGRVQGLVGRSGGALL